MSHHKLKTYMDSEERKDFLLESGFLLMSASESQTDKMEQARQGRGTHSFQTKASLQNSSSCSKAPELQHQLLPVTRSSEERCSLINRLSELQGKDMVGCCENSEPGVWGRQVAARTSHTPNPSSYMASTHTGARKAGQQG